MDKGDVSLSLLDHGQGTWQDELTYKDTKLPATAIPFIKEQIQKNRDTIMENKRDIAIIEERLKIKK